eukprot:GHRR01013826.1.p1 GENE.GHRR01013826.1~~GHRR01013826.1.p1  ORF type:complete len:386 (+),score=88.66 GHRR01013826.1:617-1774(+)
MQCMQQLEHFACLLEPCRYWLSSVVITYGQSVSSVTVCIPAAAIRCKDTVPSKTNPTTYVSVSTPVGIVKFLLPEVTLSVFHAELCAYMPPTMLSCASAYLAGNLRCNSNAYCYALDTYKDGFCAPGSSDGTDLEMGTADRITCTLLIKALIADGAKQVNKSDLGREPSKGHYIAAMARPSDCNPFTCWTTDFNMARKDSNGYWSWKMPAGPASNRDLYDNLIMDIQNATLPAHYDDFCGYFLVNNNTMTVGGSFGSDYFPELTNSTVRQQYSTSPGVTASVVPLAYNETTDGAFDADSLREQAQDRLWRSKKGMPEWDEFYAGLSENSPSPSISEDGNTGFSTTGSSNVVGTGTNVGTGSSSRTGNEGVVTPSTFGRKMLRNAS